MLKVSIQVEARKKRKTVNTENGNNEDEDDWELDDLLDPAKTGTCCCVVLCCVCVCVVFVYYTMVPSLDGAVAVSLFGALFVVPSLSVVPSHCPLCGTLAVCPLTHTSVPLSLPRIKKTRKKRRTYLNFESRFMC